MVPFNYLRCSNIKRRWLGRPGCKHPSGSPAVSFCSASSFSPSISLISPEWKIYHDSLTTQFPGVKLKTVADQVKLQLLEMAHEGPACFSRLLHRAFCLTSSRSPFFPCLFLCPFTGFSGVTSWINHLTGNRRLRICFPPAVKHQPAPRGESANGTLKSNVEAAIMVQADIQQWQ